MSIDEPKLSAVYWNYMAICMQTLCENVATTKTFDTIDDEDMPKGLLSSVKNFLKLAIEGYNDYQPLFFVDQYATFHLAQKAIEACILPLPQLRKDQTITQLLDHHYTEIVELLQKYLRFVENISKIGRPTPEHLQIAAELAHIFAWIYQKGNEERSEAFYGCKHPHAKMIRSLGKVKGGNTWIYLHF